MLIVRGLLSERCEEVLKTFGLCLTVLILFHPWFFNTTGEDIDAEPRSFSAEIEESGRRVYLGMREFHHL